MSTPTEPNEHEQQDHEHEQQAPEGEGEPTREDNGEPTGEHAQVFDQDAPEGNE